MQQTNDGPAVEALDDKIVADYLASLYATYEQALQHPYVVHTKNGSWGGLPPEKRGILLGEFRAILARAEPVTESERIVAATLRWFSHKSQNHWIKFLFQAHCACAGLVPRGRDERVKRTVLGLNDRRPGEDGQAKRGRSRGGRGRSRRERSSGRARDPADRRRSGRTRSRAGEPAGGGRRAGRPRSRADSPSSGPRIATRPRARGPANGGEKKRPPIIDPNSFLILVEQETQAAQAAQAAQAVQNGARKAPGVIADKSKGLGMPVPKKGKSAPPLPQPPGPAARPDGWTSCASYLEAATGRTRRKGPDPQPIPKQRPQRGSRRSSRRGARRVETDAGGSPPQPAKTPPKTEPVEDGITDLTSFLDDLGVSGISDWADASEDERDERDEGPGQE